MVNRRVLAVRFWVPILALIVIGSEALSAEAQLWRKINKSALVWGSFLAPSSVHSEDSDNTKFELYAKPALEVWRFSEKTSLSAYTIFALLRDSRKLDYYNKLTAGVGLEIRHRLSKAVRLSFGAKWDSERRIYSGHTYSALVATADMSVYHSWSPTWPGNRPGNNANIVLSGWANFRYPSALEPYEKSNALLQGSLKMSVVLPLASGNFKIAPFASLSAKADVKGRPYNNTFEPAVGLDLKIPIGEGAELVAGAKMQLQVRLLSGETQAGTIAYLSWYKNF